METVLTFLKGYVKAFFTVLLTNDNKELQPTAVINTYLEPEFNSEEEL